MQLEPALASLKRLQQLQVRSQMLAPMRAGSETVVTARMTGSHVTGDIVLRGKVGGEPFEATMLAPLSRTLVAS